MFGLMVEYSAFLGEWIPGRIQAIRVNFYVSSASFFIEISTCYILYV